MAELLKQDFQPSTGWSWRKGLIQPLPHYPPILARTSVEPVELSFGQQRLWFLAQLESGSAACSVPMAWRIQGALDFSALQRSLDQLVMRHEALRTTFPATGGQPRQVIAAASAVNIARLGTFGRQGQFSRRDGLPRCRPSLE